MHATRTAILVLAAAVALAACDRSGGEEAPAAETPQQQAPAASTADSTPAAALPPAADVPVASRGSNPAPTRADSIAAAKEDVSPEWKQRERSMDSYANCMEQAKSVTGPARQQLERACANLPTAP